jgi:hypothetical protein
MIKNSKNLSILQTQQFDGVQEVFIENPRLLCFARQIVYQLSENQSLKPSAKPSSGFHKR